MKEKEREITLFCEGKLCKEWKRKWQIYSKREWIRGDKIKEDEGKMNSDIKVEGSEEIKM